MAENTELNKLKALAISKIELMQASALKKFLGIVDADEKLENFKIRMSFYSFSYNNTDLGKKASGGDRYRRTVTIFENQPSNWREINITVKYYVPSGYCDGNKNEILSSYMLTNDDIAEIKKDGSRVFFVSKFNIKNDLESKNDCPINLLNSKVNLGRKIK